MKGDGQSKEDLRESEILDLLKAHILRDPVGQRWKPKQISLIQGFTHSAGSKPLSDPICYNCR